LTEPAAEFGPPELEIVTQRIEQRSCRIYLQIVRAAIHYQRDDTHKNLLLPSKRHSIIPAFNPGAFRDIKGEIERFRLFRSSITSIIHTIVRTPFRSIPVLFVVCGLAYAQQQPGAASQGRLKGLSLEQLGDIEVTTVSKGPVKVSQTAAAIYVITQEDIRRSGVKSLPEALRLAPGVDVAQIDSVKWAVGIRGFESRLSRAVLVLIDGRSVYSPLFHGVYWEVQDTLLEDIERIEVIRGPGGTIWGANAVNGVINIITKSARDTKGTLVSVGGGSVNQGIADFRVGGGNDKGFNWRVYGKGEDQASEFHSDNRQFDDSRRTQGGFRTDWDIDTRDKLTIQGDLYDGVAGESVRVTSLSPPSAIAQDQNAQLSGGNILARWQRTLSSTSDVQVQAYYDRVNRLQANQAEYRDTFDLDIVHHLALAAHQDFIWGFGARVSPGKVPEVIPTYVFTPNNRTDQLYTAYAQDSIPLASDRLSFTLGAKLLHSSFAGFDVEPSARLLWTPTSRRTIWLAVTRAVRTPSDIEDTLQSTSLLSTSPLAFSTTTGDRQFTSETLIGYEAGYRSLISKTFSVDVAGFFNKYNHLLSVEPGTPFTVNDAGTPALIYPFQNGNGVRGTTSGIEIAPDWKPREWWRLQGSWSWLRMDMETVPGSKDRTTVGSLEGSSPHHQVKIQSYFDLSKNLEFSATWRYVSALPAFAVVGYNTADARFAWRPVARVEFAVTAQNLMQPHHPEFGGDPGLFLVGIKRNVFASLTFRK
jgi:iron complex outermembrane receptor protein